MAHSAFHQDTLAISATVPATIEAFVAPQLPALSAAGWKIHILTSPGLPTTFADHAGVTVHEVAMTRAMNPVADLTGLRDWVRLLREIRPGVILGSTPKAGMLSMVAGRIVGVPRRIFLHRGARWETEKGWQRRVLMAADKVTIRSATETLAVSNSLAALLVQERVARNRPLVLGMGGSKGVDLSVFTPPPHERKVDIFSLGFVGRLSEDKGIDTVLKVLDRVRQSLPHARLIVVGDSDGTNPIDPTTMRRIESGGSIEWTGYASDVAAQMQRLDVLVFPSQREGLPNVVIEAAACGVPTVGWDATGVRDAISDGVSGRTVRRGDIDAMVEAVLAISRQDRSTVAGSCTDWARKFDQRALTSALVGYLDDGRARG